MSNVNFKELREKLTEEQIKKILARYDAQPYAENDTCIIFPTVCHNLTGGSNKLYYYKNTYLFKCYTQCEGSFDIFELIQKMEHLRGNDINLFEAIKKCDLDVFNFLTDKHINTEEDINYLYNLLNTNNEIITLPTIDDSILNRFVFDKNVLQLWVNEGISFDVMRQFNIKYDPIDNCIIIPNYNEEGQLISIRGRYLDIDAPAKYKPITYNGRILSHPSSLSLFGLNITKERIKRAQMAIIFESEKSVMMMENYYGKKNCSVATLGKNISMQQIKLLSQLGVNEVILAYDADYQNHDELLLKQKEYMKIAQVLKPYFNVCILFDFSLCSLKYKDSPIDRGKEIFEQILENRVYI